MFEAAAHYHSIERSAVRRDKETCGMYRHSPTDAPRRLGTHGAEGDELAMRPLVHTSILHLLAHLAHFKDLKKLVEAFCAERILGVICCGLDLHGEA